MWVATAASSANSRSLMRTYSSLTCSTHLLIMSFESNNNFPFLSQLFPDLQRFLVDMSFTLACIYLVLCFRSTSTISVHFIPPCFLPFFLHMFDFLVYLIIFFVPLCFFLSCIFLKNCVGHPGFSFYSIFLWENFLCRLHHTCFQYLPCTLYYFKI